MRARHDSARLKILMYLSPTNRRGVARLEAPSNRSIADAPARVIYAADIGQSSSVKIAHRGKASCVRGGGLRDDRAPELVGVHLFLLVSFAKALLTTLCVRPNLVHIAWSNPVAEPVAPQKAVPWQEAS